MAIVKKRIAGFQDGGTAVEPTTGNDVPVGALPNEVADDIDAKLSEGEFVIPADVVRYIGLERLMKLRDDAKKGLQRMAQIGQMGNAEEVGAMANSTFEGEDEEDNIEFESDIDELLSEDEGANGQTERMMAAGGLATMPFATGSDLSKAPKNPMFDVRYLKHPDGRTIYVTYYNGKPFTPIPEGFKEVTQEEALKSATAADEAEEKKTETKIQEDQQVGANAGDVDSGGPSVVGTGPGGAITAGDLATGVTPGAVQAASTVAGLVMGIPGLGLLGKGLAPTIANATGVAAGQANVAAVAAQHGLNPNNPDDLAMIQQEIDNISMGLPGPQGSSSSAISAANAAMSQAGTLGFSPEESAVIGQQAADAVSAGASPSSAVSTAVANAVADAVGMSGFSPEAAAGASAAVGGSGNVGDIGGIGDVGEGSGGASPWAKGGLVGKRKPKAKRGKGIVAQK